MTPSESSFSSNDPRKPELRFSILLLALVGMFLLPVIAGPSLGEGRLMELLWAAVLAVTIYAVGGGRKLTIVALVLGVPGVFARLISVFASTTEIQLASQVLSAAFIAFAIWVIMAAVLRSEGGTREKVFGAVCVYLLLGILWSSFYAIVETVEPGSFDFPQAATATREGRLLQTSDGSFSYYSFVTLTTLGYGDITPVGYRARTLSWLEAVVGQLFIAITIARLVGMRISTGVD